MTFSHSFNLLLSLLLQTLLATALPPLKPTPDSSPSFNALAAISKPGFWDQYPNAFPPGPPESHFFYPIPSTDTALLFTPLGHIPGRNEAVVKETIDAAISESLQQHKDRPLPSTGYKTRAEHLVMGVGHSVRMRELTWGIWTDVLLAMGWYVRAYPGYDFLFDVRLLRGEELEGIAIGSGFVMTRG